MPTTETETATARALLLLDLDGTIADTLPHVFESYRYAVLPWAPTVPTDAEVEATFGPSERECLAAMVPRSDLDEAERRFHSYYEEHYARGVTIVDGILDAIARARALGWNVAVFTGKGRRSAEFTLKELGLLDSIDLLVSSDDVKRPKPDPEGVFQASETLGIPRDRILLAGDSRADILAARGAGSQSAAVAWAAFQPERLKAHDPDWYCERVSELIEAVESLDARWKPGAGA